MWHIRKVQAGYQSAPGPVPTKLDELHSKRPSVAVPARRCPSRRGLAIETWTCLVSRSVGTGLLFGAGARADLHKSWEFLLWWWVSPCTSGSPGSLPGPIEDLPWPAALRSLKEPINTHGSWRLVQSSLDNSATGGESARPPHTSNKPSACRVYSLEPSRARARHWHVQSQSPEPGQSIPLSCFRTG